MSTLSLGISITGSAIKKFNLTPLTGPIRTAAPSVAPHLAQDGVTVTRTPGTYQPRGGGTVNLSVSEWRIGAVPVGIGSDYTPTAADVGEVLHYIEEATETGGTADGSLPVISVMVGTVLPVAPAITGFSAAQAAQDAPLDVNISFTEIENLPVTCYFAGVLSGELTPSISQIIGGNASDDSPADIVTSFVASVNGSESTSFSDVSSGTYDLHAVAVDAAGSPSGIASVLGIALTYSSTPGA